MTTKNQSAAYSIIRDHDGAVLFILLPNTNAGGGVYCLPSCQLELGEVYTAAVVRSSKQSVGVEFDQNEISFTYMQHRLSTESSGDATAWTDVYFEVGPWKGAPHRMVPETQSELRWIYLDELPDNVVPSQAYALGRIADGHLYGEYGWPLSINNDAAIGKNS